MRTCVLGAEGPRLPRACLTSTWCHRACWKVSLLMKPPNPGIRVTAKSSGSASLEGSVSVSPSLPSPPQPVPSLRWRRERLIHPFQ